MTPRDAALAAVPAIDLTPEAFLRHLWPDADGLAGHLNLWSLAGKRSRWFAAGDVDAVARESRRLAERTDVYFGTALVDLEARRQAEAADRGCDPGEVDPASIRGTNETAAAIAGAWLDVDFAGPAHKEPNLPPDWPTFRAFLDQTVPAPGVVVDSGHGAHAWWPFREPWAFEAPDERAEAADFVFRLQYTIRERARARGWNLDSTPQLAQLLRLPGTWNRKPGLEPTPVRVIEHDAARRYSRDEIEPYLLDVAWHRAKVDVSAVELPDDLAPVELGTLRLPPWIKELIRLGPAADPARYADRSRPLWRVITEMLEGGCDDATIASILLDPRYAISDKPLEQGRRAREWVANQIAKAREADKHKVLIRLSAPEPGADATGGGVRTALEADGIRYADGALGLLVVPKRKNRWQVTVLRDGAVLDTGVLDPADKAQRERLLKGAALEGDEGEALRSLALHAGLNVARDTERWLAGDAEQMAREVAAREASRKEAREALRETLAAGAWQAGRTVLTDPALLHRVGLTTRRLGLAGEAITARLTYLVLTSRVGGKPINVAVKGGSSGGKSYTVETVLRLFPEEAFWTFTTMSAKALVYVDEDFAHRHIVIYEQHGGEEADYLIRTLQSEGRLKHLVTQKQPDGNYVAVAIEKEGPTGFVTTTTRTALHDENETRIWSVSIDESEQQTVGVLDSVADRYNSRGPEPDLEPWRAAQRWLGLAGATAANVGYSHWLAQRMPSKPLRIRRDFGRLLALIETSAVLFQAQRERGADGRVIATVHDYANAYALVADVFTATQQGVTRRTGEILRMLQRLYDEKVARAGEKSAGEISINYEELMQAAGIGKPAVSKHMTAAIELGLVENLETRERAAAKLRPRLELLTPGTDLPSPEALAADFPELAGGVWVHPLTGEEKNFLPAPPGNGGNSGNSVAPPGGAAVSAGPATGMETVGVAAAVDRDVSVRDRAVSAAVSAPSETGRPGGREGAISAVSSESRAENFDEDLSYDDEELPW